jgi:hypothetical protein
MKPTKINPATAGVAGLAIGTMVGVALTAMLDPRIRRKAKQKADQLNSQAHQAWQQVEPELRQAGSKIKSSFPSDLLKGNGRDIEELAVKGGEVSHEVDDITTTEQFKEVKDLTNH